MAKIVLNEVKTQDFIPTVKDCGYTRFYTHGKRPLTLSGTQESTSS